MRYTVAFISVLLLCSSFGYAQVGVDNTDPDPSSILDLASTDKGLLIPRMTSAERLAISSPATSLLVFDTTVEKYYYFKDGEWFVVNEWTRLPGTSKITYSGDVQVTGNIQAASFSGVAFEGTIPVGGIIMWSGSVGSIPAGWALCNGANGAPDLRDRFLVGAGSSYSPGSTGGANSVTLSVAEIPSHAHIVNSAGNHTHTESTAGSHTHSMPSGGSHSHTFTHGRNGGIDSNPNGGGWARPTLNPISESTDYGGSHSHAINSAGNHTHTIAAAGDHSHTAQNTGGSGSHENRPPYYALAFIMRVQ